MLHKKNWLVFAGLLMMPFLGFAQGGGPAAAHVFGKVVDAASGKGTGFATVGILRARDSSVAAGVLSQTNGDFNIEKLPAGDYVLRINFIGYNPVYKNFSVSPASREQDLGNFKLRPSSNRLKEAVVTADKSTFTMAIDKKVFNVDKSLASKGGTATDALRQVPTVNVDIDGNVSLRNGSPTIFIDGKKSPLTLDQIPADEIESIEIITNPSAKYDAEGMSGIINIVLKKDRKPGVNGTVMAGVGTQDQYNGGVNMNIYQKPLNLSLGYFANSRSRTHDGTTERQNLFNGSSLSQVSHEYSNGTFQMGRLGLDYYIDNRNTISISGGMGGGNFKSKGYVNSDYFNSGKTKDSSSTRNTVEDHKFRFYSADLNFTHNFSKEKEQLTIEGGYRGFKGPGSGNYNTQYYDVNGDPFNQPLLQKYTNGGNSDNFTFQSDYTNPLMDGKAKLEAGVKVQTSDSRNDYQMNDYDYNTKDYIINHLTSLNYNYKQQTYAAYTNFSQQIGNFGYQAGLRFEQYDYKGTMVDSSSSFTYNKPGLFPSVFLSQKIGGGQELQLNYSRRVDRPNWREISPRIDYSDPQNPRQGNPELQPEYTNSFEFSYNNVFGASNLLATLYFRNTNNLITSYVTPIGTDTLLNTYVNANSSNTYGAEITLRTPLTKWWMITANANLFQTNIKASNIKTGLTNSGLSWFAKANSEMRLPANFTIQLTGNYEAPRIIPQGTIEGDASMDAALRKDFLKNKALSLTFSVSDVFNTDKNIRHTESPGYFIQDAERKRLSRIFKINLSYRFGKQDFSLFKKRSKSQGQGGQGGGNDMMMGDQD